MKGLGAGLGTGLGIGLGLETILCLGLLLCCYKLYHRKEVHQPLCYGKKKYQPVCHGKKERVPLLTQYDSTGEGDSEDFGHFREPILANHK